MENVPRSATAPGHIGEFLVAGKTAVHGHHDKLAEWKLGSRNGASGMEAHRRCP